MSESEYKIEYYNDGNKKKETWFKDGLLHRNDDLPAVIKYFTDGKVAKTVWYQNGIKHREGDLPAYISYISFFNTKKEEHWYKNGEFHREGDLPCYIRYHIGNLISEVRWGVNGKFREGELPGAFYYNHNGTKLADVWYRDNKIHRDNQPAVIAYFDDGNINVKNFFINGVRCCFRLNEEYKPIPPRTIYKEDGTVDTYNFLFVSGDVKVKVRPSVIIKLNYYFRKYVKKVRQRLRERMLERIRNTKLYNIRGGKDICRYITQFVY